MKIGILKKVELREIWSREDTDIKVYSILGQCNHL